MSRNIANPERGRVSATCSRATMATASRGFTSATETTIVWTIRMKTAVTSAETGSVTRRRNSRVLPTNNGVRHPHSGRKDPK